MFGKQLTDLEKQFIRDWYLIIPTNRVAYNLGRSETIVRNYLKKNGFTIPSDLLKQFIDAGRIKPGSIPPNKGRKGYCAPGSEKGWFKKGQQPKNTLYDGAITLRADTRTKIIYKYIRLAKSRWEPYHTYLWKKKYGKVKKGHVIIFKDGNTGNCKLKNLKQISRRDNMFRNTIHRYSPELKSAIFRNASLKRKITKKVQQWLKTQ